MSGFSRGAVTEIANDADDVCAFRVDGSVDAEASKALAEYMNDVFDRTGTKVHMLFDLRGFDSSEASGLFDTEVLRSRLRAVSKVGKYAVVGAPEAAERMIETMDRIIPVDARTFGSDRIDAAWDFVGARPATA